MGIYNIGTGRAGSWNEIANALFKAIGKPANIQYIETQDLVGKYQNYTCADMRKTTAVLQKEALCAPLEESVVEYVSQYLLPEKNMVRLSGTFSRLGFRKALVVGISFSTPSTIRKSQTHLSRSTGCSPPGSARRKIDPAGQGTSF